MGKSSRPPLRKSSPPKVLVRPLFDFPPLNARTRKLESPYHHHFGKMALRCLFDDNFEEAKRFTTRIMLKPSNDVDFIATVTGPLDNKPGEGIEGSALFRLEKDYRELHICHDMRLSAPGLTCSVKSSTYFPLLGIGATWFFRIISKSGVWLGDYAAMGFRCDPFSNLSFGATINPREGEYPSTAWLVSRLGRLTAGVHYEPKLGSKGGAAPYENMANWSGAISYGSESGSPLTPSFSFGFELANNSRFITSFYKHMVIQRRDKNQLEKYGALMIKNYVDFGFELHTRADDGKVSNKIEDSTFQVAVSWQINTNILMKGKVGPLTSSIALAFKSWCKPSFTLDVSAVRDRIKGETSFGFGMQFDGIRQQSYQRALPSIIM